MKFLHINSRTFVVVQLLCDLVEIWWFCGILLVVDGVCVWCTEVLASYNDEDIYLFDCTRPEYRCSTYLHRYTGHRNNATGSVCECWSLWFSWATKYIVSYCDSSRQARMRCSAWKTVLTVCVKWRVWISMDHAASTSWVAATVAMCFYGTDGRHTSSTTSTLTTAASYVYSSLADI